ncbi:MAG: sulfatase [Thermodesulfobacteriota bacterium]
MTALRAACFAAVIAALAWGARSVPAGSASAGAPRNLVLVTVDTLRADHLGFAGYPRDTSPNLDRLAAEGVWFPRVYSHSATTGAAHASLFTSLPPREHGVTANSQPFPDKPSLMRALSERGWYTAGFVSSVVMSRKSKVQRHFEHFDDELTTTEANRKARYERPAARTVTAALAALDRRPQGKPFFLWLHLIDPHGPYAAPVEPDRYVGDAHYGRIGKQLPIGDTDWEHYEIPRYQAIDGRTDADFYVARYDAEIRYTDAALGTLLAELAQRGLDRDTVVVVTADHGETLAEPGHQRYFSHGAITYEETVRVPLVIREPAGERRLASIDREQPISSLDVAPTLLALLEVPAPATFRGRNLLASAPAPDAPMFSLGGYGTDNLERNIGTQFSVRRGHLRYIVNTKDGSEELYDHRSDPGETRNLIAKPPVPVAELRAGLDATVGERDVARSQPPPPSAEHAAALKALGYVE